MYLKSNKSILTLWDSVYNKLSGNNISSNNNDGIYLSDSVYNTLSENNISSNNNNGFYLSSSNNNTLNGNIVSDNLFGIFLQFSRYNKIYNNFFKNEFNVTHDMPIPWPNFWNTTINSGINIVGGPNLGGNFWADPNGTGFSQTCPDANSDGICNIAAQIFENNIDYLPLSMNFSIDTISPANITNLTNMTYAPTYINFTWTNPPDPDYHHVMLYFNGSFKTSIQAPQNYYNFTGLAPDTLYELGTHTVDTSGNINLTWVNATVRTAPGTTNVTPSITVVSPDGGENWARGTTQTIRWTYSGTPGSFVNITLLKSGVFDRTINSSTSIGSSGSGSYAWLINPNQAIGTDYKIMVTSTTNPAFNDTSNNNFNIPAASLTIVSPNGEESLIRGTTQTIKWNSSGSPGAYVKIELMKSGIFNRTIITSTPNDGTHPWLILATQTPGTDYKVKITSTTNASYNDTSDNSFTIPIPSFKVVFPNGKENWTRGTTQTIRWNSTENPKSYVKIELLKAGIFNRIIIASTLNDGSHPWLIPATQAPGTDYKIRVSSTTNLSNNDTSDNSFTIPVPSFTVVSPNGSENWTRGTTKTIRWNSTENPKSYVKIELLKPGVANKVIIASTLNDGSHPWLIPGTQASGDDYKVKITSTINVSNNDTSDGNFTIPVPSFKIVSPNGGENWTRGAINIINWTSTENPKSYVKIELLRPGKPNQLIISATLNDGSHPWLIPALQTSGTDYKLKITSIINASNNDTSDGNFTIPVPSFTVVFPNGGENWRRGTTQTIKWNSTESPGTYVKIELLKPGVANKVIIASTLNDGSHPWLIPATQTPGDDYKVKITSTINASNNDTSDENFTIPVPSITVTTPNGGETWRRGTTQTIKWNSTESPLTYVKIELLKAGVLNRVIIASTLNDGIHPWPIPTTQALGSDFKIRINNTINPAITDSADNNFNISS
ncbi:MAG: Ser-Thr-rich GPI-anchored membrane family protein [Candidatus Methanoperedens sp.]